MCSPAAVVSSDARVSVVSLNESVSSSHVLVLRKRVTLGQRFSDWVLGWKQMLIAELVSVGSPKEGFR